MTEHDFNLAGLRNEMFTDAAAKDLLNRLADRVEAADGDEEEVILCLVEAMMYGAKTAFGELLAQLTEAGFKVNFTPPSGA